MKRPIVGLMRFERNKTRNRFLLDLSYHVH